METGTPLNKTEVLRFCEELYALDAELSINRAKVMGDIIRNMTDEQKQSFASLSFNDSSTWPLVDEKRDKRQLSHRAHVALMTYASELFSWMKGSVEADTYFCPERHGTYFGGFFLKDYPAMGNKEYFISTALTGDAGKAFMDLLNPDQQKLMTQIPDQQRRYLNRLVELRKQISTMLRLYITGEMVDTSLAQQLIREYGKMDGEMSFRYACVFQQIYSTLSVAQKSRLKQLRGLDVVPDGIYLFSDLMKNQSVNGENNLLLRQ